MKYAGRADMIVILSYKTLASKVDMPELGKLNTIVGLGVSCHVSQDVGIVVVACVVICKMLSQ